MKDEIVCVLKVKKVNDLYEIKTNINSDIEQNSSQNFSIENSFKRMEFEYNSFRWSRRNYFC